MQCGGNPFTRGVDPLAVPEKQRTKIPQEAYDAYFFDIGPRKEMFGKVLTELTSRPARRVGF